MAKSLFQVLIVSVLALMMTPSIQGASPCKENGMGDCYIWQEVTDCINGYFGAGVAAAACNTAGAQCCQSYDNADLQQHLTDTASAADGLCTAAGGGCRHFSNFCAGAYNGNPAHCAGFPARQCCV
ncbi:uncharacterized protein LOC120335421 [Styela clava]|uniref:uncharacterized protein LOC120327264 n=1 Tax=Styela clava TaxID=7725 RepID=UPI001939930C|nr:uncharacterized protein LOC120327264 [Styela clava]